MKHVLSLLSAASAAAILAIGALAPLEAAAQSCQIDNGGGCLREGMRCNPPAKGRCKTERVGTRELKCVCTAGRPSGDAQQEGGESSGWGNPPRSSRPAQDQPDREPQEDQEPQPEG